MQVCVSVGDDGRDNGRGMGGRQEVGERGGGGEGEGAEGVRDGNGD